MTWKIGLTLNSSTSTLIRQYFYLWSFLLELDLKMVRKNDASNKNGILSYGLTSFS